MLQLRPQVQQGVWKKQMQVLFLDLIEGIRLDFDCGDLISKPGMVRKDNVAAKTVRQGFVKVGIEDDGTGEADSDFPGGGIRRNRVLQGEVQIVGEHAQDHLIVNKGGYSINANSQVQDGAWVLIEFMMTYYFHNDNASESSTIFSPFESQLAYMMDLSMVKMYQRNQNYDIYLDEDGQPVEASKYKSCDKSGDVIAESPAARPEDVANLRQLIDAASLLSDSGSNSLYQIASEEIGIYLSGQRSAEETVDIIQNRVQLYLDENK